MGVKFIGKIDGDHYTIVFLIGANVDEVNNIIYVEKLFTPVYEVSEAMSLDAVKKWAVYNTDKISSEIEFENKSFEFDYISNSNYEEIYDYFKEKLKDFENLQEIERETSITFKAEKDGFEIYVLIDENSYVLVSTDKIY